MSGLRWFVVIGGGLLVVLLLVSAFVGPFPWGCGFLGYGRGIGAVGSVTTGRLGFPFMGMMGLGMLIFWVLVIGGCVSLVRPFAHSLSARSALPQGESPLDILKRRHSRGEITKEQFEETKRDLGI